MVNREKRVMVGINLFFLFLGACSSSSLRNQENFDEVSSCYLEKHPTQDYYRIYSKGQLLYDNWYDEDYAQKIMASAIKRGRCR